jgi:tRNA pseudouridine55 synthase
MDGVIVVNKPQGLTSHDVVAAARRALGEPAIGHTGTLDPLATGVLPLAIGRATRLARFMTASDKDYRATIRFGLTTDSYDITGAATGGTGQTPSPDALRDAMRRLTGDYLQAPPAFSAKKIEGRRAYRLARQDQPVSLTPLPVQVMRADLVDVSGARAVVALTCSAGFYVRSFAHSLGELTGTGACLEALERTRSGEFGLDLALGLDGLQNPELVASSLIPMAAILRRFPAVTVTDRGRAHVSHGRELMPEDLAGPGEPSRAVTTDQRPAAADRAWVRLFDGTGALVALATTGRAPGSLHPAVVLI